MSEHAYVGTAGKPLLRLYHDAGRWIVWVALKCEKGGVHVFGRSEYVAFAEAHGRVKELLG